METKSWHFVDKSQFPSGPWNNEPDKVQWPDKTTGLPCLAVRNHAGAWCGYVGVDPSHPCFGVDYNSIPQDLNCHGGLTFSDQCSGEEHGICHVVENEEDRVWWLGFDCNHSFDLAPAYARDRARGQYRDLAYVQEQCAQLALQLNPTVSLV